MERNHSVANSSLRLQQSLIWGSRRSPIAKFIAMNAWSSSTQKGKSTPFCCAKSLVWLTIDSNMMVVSRSCSTCKGVLPPQFAQQARVVHSKWGKSRRWCLPTEVDVYQHATQFPLPCKVTKQLCVIQKFDTSCLIRYRNNTSKLVCPNRLGQAETQSQPSPGSYAFLSQHQYHRLGWEGIRGRPRLSFII